MALIHAAPATVVHAGALGPLLADARTETLVNEHGLQIFRLVLRAGQRLAEHAVPSAMVIQCLEGHISFVAGGRELALEPGDLCHLPPAAPHAVFAPVASSALVTLHGPLAGSAANSAPPHQETRP
jgi:quercetin dioxygenase-like cupin family protein